MLKRYTFWFWAAVVFQFLTAVFHTVGIVVKPEPVNDTERQLMQLMTTYKIDAGVGFTPTMSDLMTALSSCFSLLCLFAGMLNALVLRKRATEILKGVLVINLLVFAILFALMAIFTFIPPIVMTGLIFACLLVAFATFRMHKPTSQ
ncbi:MAG: LIC_13387 family protein [Blastocatellia bacterium]